MSVVAIKVYDNKIVMSADSITIRGGDMTPIGKGKIFEVNDMIIGTSGYSSEGSMMMLFAENHTPYDASEKSMVEFMLEFNEWRNKNWGTHAGLENSYIIAYRGKAFYVHQNYIAEIVNFFAIGYGADYAEAALYLGHTPEEAVQAACALCCYVAEPIITKTMYKVKGE